MKTILLTRRVFYFLLTRFTLVLIFTAYPSHSQIVLNSHLEPGDWDFDGQSILGHVGQDIYLWDAESGSILKKFNGYAEEIRTVKLSNDSEYFLSSTGMASYTGCVNPKGLSLSLWSVKKGKEVWTLNGRGHAVFSNDGKRVVTFGETENSPCLDGDLEMWDTASGRKIFAIREDEAARETSVSFSSNDKILLAYIPGRAITLVYDAADGRKLAELEGTRNPRFFGSQGSIIALKNGQSVIWDSSTRQLRIPQSIEKSINPVYAFAWTSDGYQLAGQVINEPVERDTPVGCNIGISNYNSGRTVYITKCGRGDSVLAFSPDNTKFLMKSGGYYSAAKFVPARAQISMWNIELEKKLWSMDAGNYFILFAPNGKTFITLQTDKSSLPAKKVTHYSLFNSDTGVAIASENLEP